jgi:hypothetical protein
MVRVEFETLEQATAWIKDFTVTKEYVCYYTKKQELIFVPLKSTRPSVYGYIKKADKDDVRNLALENQMKIYLINRFEWNAERDLAKDVEEIKVKDYISEELKSLADKVAKNEKDWKPENNQKAIRVYFKNKVYHPGETVWKGPNVYIKKNILEELEMYYFNGVWHMTKVGKNCIRKYYQQVCQKTIDTRLYNYSRYVVKELNFRKEVRLGKFGYEFKFTKVLK